MRVRKKAEGIATPCIVYRLLEELEGDLTAEEETDIKNFAGTFYNGMLKSMFRKCCYQ